MRSQQTPPPYSCALSSSSSRITSPYAPLFQNRRIACEYRPRMHIYRVASNHRPSPHDSAVKDHRAPSTRSGTYERVRFTGADLDTEKAACRLE